jgi:hypothetical protein
MFIRLNILGLFLYTLDYYKMMVYSLYLPIKIEEIFKYYVI